jgi:hypothetical protein
MASSIADPVPRQGRGPRFLRVADLLPFEDDLQVRGLALLEQFLMSGDSPHFHPSPEESPEHSVRRIRAALLLR